MAGKRGKTETERLGLILKTLKAGGPSVTPGLDYRSPWEMLVATVLSAQCTDARVNKVTPSLFRRWKGPEELMGADAGEVEDAVKTCGLYRTKAKNLIFLAGIVVREHGGKVPVEREALESLPGVGRKTASVVLSQAFGKPAFAVDTHVGRVSMRLGFSSTREPLAVERAMTALMPPEAYREAHLLLIRHGREVCVARKPHCRDCPVASLCPFPADSKTGRGR